MSKYKIISTLVAAALLLSGCAAPANEPVQEGQEQQDTNVSSQTEPRESEQPVESESEQIEQTEPTEEAEPDYSALSEEEYRELLIERSLITTGDTSRVEAALRKAKNGGEITVAYIGGSITEGLTAGADKCWAKLSYDWLCEQLPEGKINYVNAGMSGTPSTLGIVRAERDVIAPNGNPDIVFIEFAVNDGGSAMDKNAYESLVRRMLSLDEDAAVVLLFTVLKNGYTCETTHMKEIGEHYNLPMISVNTALTPEFKAGRMEWEKYSDDESHPNEWGHVLVKDFVANYFEQVLNGMGDEKPINDISSIEPLFGADYTNVHLLDRQNLTAISLGEYTDDKETLAQFPNGWTRKGGDNLGISFEITCKDLFVVFHCSKSTKFATAEVYVDGEYATDVISSKESGWGNPEAQLLFNGDEVKTHTVEFKMAEGDEGKYFGILGFGYTD